MLAMMRLCAPRSRQLFLTSCLHGHKAPNSRLLLINPSSCWNRTFATGTRYMDNEGPPTVQIQVKDEAEVYTVEKAPKKRFTAEDDALIAQRVAEWGKKGNGLWPSLEREMGISSRTIYARYKTIQPSARFVWAPVLDARLMEGVALHKEMYGWVRVAEYVGGGVTGKQCKNRWRRHLGKPQLRCVNQGGWTRNQLRILEELVPHHVIKPFWSEQYRVKTQERIDWTAIAEYLNKIPNECRDKWHVLQGTFKKVTSRVKSRARVWSDGQILKLEELVVAHTIEPEYSESLQGITKINTDWTTIGRLLAVDPKKCKAKWRSIQDRGKKKGRFTAEEDALIVHRVAVWGDKGPGLWVSLEREMGRSADGIFKRYRKVTAPARKAKSSARTMWTPVMDARLTEGVALHKENDGWAGVAEYVGGEATALQCMDRWNKFLNKTQQEGITRGVWTHDEARKLEELVPRNTIKPYWCGQLKGLTKERIDWTAIGQELNRIPAQCMRKWKSIQDRGKTKGPFTAEEDSLIAQRVAEWGDKGPGLWSSLGQEMGRNSSTAFHRYRRVILSDRAYGRIIWTPDMDARLTEGVTLYKEKDRWATVAECVGGEVTAPQCKKRWNMYLRKAQQEGINQRDWSDEEVLKLEELVPQCVIKPHWCELRKVMAKERTDWTAVAAHLNRIPKKCKAKWKSIQDSRKTIEHFTAEEDALIAQRVAEWGNKGRRLWSSLGREMGRDSSAIARRYRSVILVDTTVAQTVWTADLDARLTEGVALYKEKHGWARVAEYVGGEATAPQCAIRWIANFAPVPQNVITRGVWTHDEVRKLKELVPQCVIKSSWYTRRKIVTTERIDWIAIAAQLSRIPMECMKKWKGIQVSMLKKGPFTAEEDALIRQRVAEWGDKGRGLWVNLQKEMSRPLKNVYQRWTNVLASRDLDWVSKDSKLKKGPFTPEEDALVRQRVAEWGDKGRGLWVSLQKELGRGAKCIRKHRTSALATRDVNWLPKESCNKETFTPLLSKKRTEFEWSPDVDTRLKESVAKHTEKEGRAGVAKYVARQEMAQQEGVRRGKWTDAEVEELQQLVPQHVIESRWSEKHKVMTKERIDWTAIGDKLHRVPQDCNDKWRNLRDSKLKIGPFTTEEDALIRQRVAEWGDNGNGLWVSLQKEMGRRPDIIIKHWTSNLKTQRPSAE